MTDLEIALRYSPLLHHDVNDPIPLRAVGYTVFRRTAPSVSFPGRVVKAPLDGFTVEYAYFYNYDIEHMYDLEHVWVFVENGRVTDAQGSFHGKYLNLFVPGLPGTLPPEDGHVQVFAHPGKHAMLASPLMTKLYPGWEGCCREAKGPVLIGNPFTAKFSGTGKDLFVPSPQDNDNSSWYLRTHLSFEPSLDFSRIVRPDAACFMPWDELYEKIPGWIAQECARIAALRRQEEERGDN